MCTISFPICVDVCGRYDITNRSSFDEIRRLKKQIDRLKEIEGFRCVPVVLIGNKVGANTCDATVDS